jgi:enamine deaminase RidA (YjgF/YER057c/UK114 family)
LVFTAGQLPVSAGALVSTGLVGGEVDVDTAVASAAVAALNVLAAASTVCDLDSVTRVVKVTVYVASAEGFVSQPAVANGASEVFAAAFGPVGVHARAAVGVRALPLGAPVEVDAVLEIADA